MSEETEEEYEDEPREEYKKLIASLEQLRIHSGFALTFALSAGEALSECTESTAKDPEFKKILAQYNLDPAKIKQLLELYQYHEKIMIQLQKADYNMGKAISLVKLYKHISKNRIDELIRNRSRRENKEKGDDMEINLN